MLVKQPQALSAETEALVRRVLESDIGQQMRAEARAAEQAERAALAAEIETAEQEAAEALPRLKERAEAAAAKTAKAKAMYDQAAAASLDAGAALHNATARRDRRRSEAEGRLAATAPAAVGELIEELDREFNNIRARPGGDYSLADAKLLAVRAAQRMTRDLLLEPDLDVIDRELAAIRAAMGPVLAEAPRAIPLKGGLPPVRFPALEALLARRGVGDSPLVSRSVATRGA